MSEADTLMESDFGDDVSSLPLQTQPPNNKQFRIDGFVSLITCATCLSLLLTVLGWVNSDAMGNGLSLEDGRQFNWHPVMMILAFILLVLGIVSFNSPVLSQFERKTRKAAHGICMLCAIGCAIFGLYAVFQSHNNTGKDGVFVANMYSLHSWVGIGVFSSFGAQFLIGFVFFGAKVGSDSLRSRIIGILTWTPCRDRNVEQRPI